jgi:hypothetical protein
MGVLPFKRDAVDDEVANPRGDRMVNVNVAMVVLATAMVIARFWTRMTINKILGRDDWCILASLVSLWVPTHDGSTVSDSSIAHRHHNDRPPRWR